MENRTRREWLCALGAGRVAAGLSNGVVTSAKAQQNPTEIQDWTDLDAIRNDLDGDYILITDLDENTTGYETVAGPNANGGVGFQPIGDRDAEFTGTFDAQNNSIADLSISRPAEDRIGLFGEMGSDGTVKNIELLNADIAGARYVGAVAGNNSGEIVNSSVEASINASSNVGGIAGETFFGLVAGSSADVIIDADTAAGGLVGTNFGDIADSDAKGSVTAAGGDIIDTPTAGGVVGDNFGRVVNSHYDIDEMEINGENRLTLGGLFDQQYQDWIGGEKELDISDYDSLSLSDGVIEISNAEGVRNALGFIHDPEFDQRLADDIDLTGEDSNLYFPYLIGDFDGDGHTVAVDIDNPAAFAIGFIGQAVENTVIDLSITGDVTGTKNVGAVIGKHSSSVDDTATIGNATVEATVDGDRRVGGIVGEADGQITNSAAEVAVTGDSTVGGLVGRNFAEIIDSSADGQVTGNSTIGGLVGYNGAEVTRSFAACDVTIVNEGILQQDAGGLIGSSQGDIKKSFAVGTVSGSSNVGGLVGRNGASIADSYATGAVTGDQSVGGLVGRSRNGVIANSYAVGSTTGSSEIGGLTGRLEAPLLPDDETVLRDSYWDTEMTGQPDVVGEIEEGEGAAELRGELTGLETSQMQGESAAQTMEALDFINTWRVVTNPPGYPELRSLSDGSDSDPLAPYTNSNNIVDIDGLLDALDDWRGGEIGVDLLLDVLDAWRSGDPVT